MMESRAAFESAPSDTDEHWQQAVADLQRAVRIGRPVMIPGTLERHEPIALEPGSGVAVALHAVPFQQAPPAEPQREPAAPPAAPMMVRAIEWMIRMLRTP
jgi:hypothetical protein